MWSFMFRPGIADTTFKALGIKASAGWQIVNSRWGLVNQPPQSSGSCVRWRLGPPPGDRGTGPPPTGRGAPGWSWRAAWLQEVWWGRSPHSWLACLWCISATKMNEKLKWNKYFCHIFTSVHNLHLFNWGFCQKQLTISAFNHADTTQKVQESFEYRT